MPAILDQVNLVARDIDKSADFYRRLGCDVPDVEPNRKSPPYHLNCGLQSKRCLAPTLPSREACADDDR